MILDGGNEQTVKTIVLMEAFDSELVARGQERGIEVLSLKDFEVRTSSSCLNYLSGVLSKVVSMELLGPSADVLENDNDSFSG